VTRMVNGLIGKSDLGAPFICAYLLGYPDHYTNRIFKTVYWHSYVQHIRRQIPDPNHVHANEPGPDNVVVARQDDGIIALARINDYLYRPLSMESWTLYDFLSYSDPGKAPKHKPKHCHPEDDLEEDLSENQVRTPSDPNDFIGLFTEGHPQHATHGMFRISACKIPYTLNFVGGALPQPDKANPELYYLTMLILFNPSGWRSGHLLNPGHEPWQTVFERTTFTANHLRVMKNMTVLNECKDARDDFAA
ncbi:hypothetical protein OH76DRAFT_1310582, partial [Lentinus brumalis]